MGKKLISAGCVEEYIVTPENKIYIDSTMILAPGAKDLLRNKGVVIVYGERPEPASEPVQEKSCEAETPCQEESLETSCDSGNQIKKVVQILRDDYGINDADKIREICICVMKKLMDN